jgi:hypothetical protein
VVAHAILDAPSAAFSRIAVTLFNGDAFCMFYGGRLDQSDWELHFDTDELLMVLEGSVSVEILTDTDRHRLPRPQASSSSCPRVAGTVVEVFFTPGTTLECAADDPRLAPPETYVPDMTPGPTRPFHRVRRASQAHDPSGRHATQSVRPTGWAS